ncbi:MAG: heme exporter protein CcmB [Gemmatimonas sp.]
MSAFVQLVRRELRLALRGRGESALAVAFFVLGAVLFAFGAGPERQLLARIGAGAVWAMALFAAMLSLERMFGPDYEDGTLDQLLLAPLGAEGVALAKAAAHWITTGIPLLIAAPIVAMMFGLDGNGIGALALGLLLGTPVLTLIGCIGAALSVGSRLGGVLLSLLVLPLLIPVLIFGVAAVNAVADGGGFTDAALEPLVVLAGLLLLALGIAPIAAGAALRQALE